MLNYDTYGGGDAPLLIVHGLYGSARNWGVISRRLAETRRVIAVDMRNHAGSPWFDSHSYADLAVDLAEVIRAEAPMGADVLGHSMGGKASMVLALSQPELVRALIVADIAPVAYGHSQLSYIQAMRAVDLSAVNTRGDANRMLADTVPEEGIRAFLLQSLDVKERRWRLNLDVLAKEMDGITGWPSDVAGTYTGPALFLSGGDSTYVTPEGRAAAKALFPKARFAKIPGTGHWLHAEKPREFEAAVRMWLEAQAVS